jgi:histone H3/H4
MVKDFPLAPLEKILKKAGAARISKEALIELKSTLLDITSKIALDAIRLSHHAKRITIKREDIKLAGGEK